MELASKLLHTPLDSFSHGPGVTHFSGSFSQPCSPPCRAFSRENTAVSSSVCLQSSAEARETSWCCSPRALSRLLTLRAHPDSRPASAGQPACGSPGFPSPALASSGLFPCWTELCTHTEIQAELFLQRSGWLLAQTGIRRAKRQGRKNRLLVVLRKPTQPCSRRAWEISAFQMKTNQAQAFAACSVPEFLILCVLVLISSRSGVTEVRDPTQTLCLDLFNLPSFGFISMPNSTFKDT